MNARSRGMIAAVIGLPVLMLVGLFSLIVLIAEENEHTPHSASPACASAPIEINTEQLPKEVAGFSGRQLENAAVIVTVAAERGLGQRAATIAVMTAITESGLKNLANAGKFERPAESNVLTQAQWEQARATAMLSLQYPNDGTAAGDWDSVGLFQSRASAGWAGYGTADEQVQNLLNPTYTSGRFFDALTAVAGWQTMDLGQAAQAVQRSAFPDAYDENRLAALKIVAAVQGIKASVAGLGSCVGGYAGTVSADGWVHPAPAYGGLLTGRFGDPRTGYTHQGLDLAGPLNTPILAAADGVVVHATCERWQGRSPCSMRLDHGKDTQGRTISTLYVHMYSTGLRAQVGDTVKAGDHIADMGSNGNSTGSHLHFEVWIDQTPVDPEVFLRDVGVPLR